MVKAVIFDWSGTLSDNFHLFYKVCDKIFAEFGKAPISADEVRRTFTIPYMKFWNTHLPYLSKEKQDVLYRKFIYEVGEPKLFNGIKGLLSGLHSKGILVFVVTSDPRQKVMGEIASGGVGKYLSGVLAEAHEKNHLIKQIVAENKLAVNEVYYVGDSSGDIEEGKLAGVKTVGVSWGFQNKDVLKNAKPDFLVNSIAQLKAVLA